ncbi:TldD/PmbA family protein [Stakelama pacifica]|uniref:Microcin-processing peptidase 1 n=1 Tax=Stakelama pacifica TaxID=517720 RepID=A0A4R6FUR3_9SPHN|nr:metallopeptidase TldD-related protein [Stakelama pacifica]TDN85551.1 microcin-processing peptidase 1 [Stakelama pacifica]GGO92313.1 modulator protein [Stakelama pacifica]
MLTPEQAKDRACAAVERAIRAGADAADAAISTDTAIAVSVRLGALEEVERSEGADLSLRVFIGQRSASVGTGELDDAALDDLARRAVRMAREASEDRWSGLAPAERLMKGAPPALDLDDGAEVSPETLKADALAAEAAAREVAGVTNSEGGSASASRVVIALATSHGFAGAYALTSHAVSASVLAGTGEGMQRDYAHHSARHRDHLESSESIGRRAGERAVAKLNPARMASGAMPIIFDPRIAPGLLGAFTGAISGARIARRTSFLQDMLGKQVFARGVRIEDDPHRPRGLRSRPFDGEGLPVSPMTIVEDGMLESWLLDSAAARQLGLEPTGHASRGGGTTTSNLYMANGSQSVEALIADIDTGLWVTEAIGQGINPVTGDYSRGASGFLIEKGEVTRPVSEITIAGNLKDMFLNMTPANDLEFRYGVNTPTLRVDGMTVAGD